MTTMTGTFEALFRIAMWGGLLLLLALWLYEFAVSLWHARAERNLHDWSSRRQVLESEPPRQADKTPPQGVVGASPDHPRRTRPALT